MTKLLAILLTSVLAAGIVDAAACTRGVRCPQLNSPLHCMRENFTMPIDTRANSRRRFLAQTAAIASTTLFPWDATSSCAFAKSPNERLRFALIGVEGNGTRTSPVGQKFADLVALCDVEFINGGSQLVSPSSPT